MSMKWDIFISHAHEDKEEIARPLADRLDHQGLSVWFDEDQLEVGDSLVEAVGNGLRQSRYGLVILSPAFLGKVWTVNELNSLFCLENASQRRILPVWHQLTIEQVRDFSPMLADRVALRTSDGLDSIVRQIVAKFPQLAYIDESGPLSGRWFGSSGRLLLRHEAGMVLGDYDWHGKPWVGTLQGLFSEEGILNFNWSWKNVDKRGNGLFGHTIVGDDSRDPNDYYRMLVGAWWHEGTNVDIPDLLEQLRSSWKRLYRTGIPLIQYESVFPWSFTLDTRRYSLGPPLPIDQEDG